MSKLLFIFLIISTISYSQKVDTNLVIAIEDSIENCDDSKLVKLNASLKAALDNLINGKLNNLSFIHKHLSILYNNIGYEHENKSDIKNALKYYQLGLHYAELANNLNSIASAYQNLASLYDNLGDYKKSLEYYYKSLAIKIQTKNTKGIGYSLCNIGYVHSLNGNYDSALAIFGKSLRVFEELNDSANVSLVYNNMGYVYLKLKNFNKALMCFDKTIYLQKLTNNYQGLSYSYINLCEVNYTNKNLGEAKKYGILAYDLAKKYGKLSDRMKITFLLNKVLYETGDYKKAYEFNKEHHLIKDSIVNNENKTAIVKQQLNYEHEKELTKMSLQKAIEKQKNETEKNKQKTILTVSLIFLLVVVAFSLFLFNRYKIISNQKIVIEEQKSIVEQKSKEIESSINYAKRIQDSFFASKEIFDSNFTDNFILFKPRDIVSGDFYWANKINKSLYLCVADSTGHGIPGAFMSLLNISLLNEATLSKNIAETNEILNFVRKILLLGLKPDEQGQGGNDGMDCILVSLDLETLILNYSGANNPLWILRNNKVIELNPNKMPVGRSPKDAISFTTEVFQLQKNDTLYLFTDGYPDQFGGPKGKKFKYKQLEDYLIEINKLTMREQKQLLENKFINWKGNLDQVDDVTIIGLRI